MDTEQINQRNTNEFIAMTAHDLRGVIASIYGLNRLLEEKLQDLPDKDTKEMTALITSQCEQGVALTAGLIGTYKASLCSLTKLLTKQIDLYKIQTENKLIELKTDIPQRDIYVETQPIFLIRVLDNLIDNAVKFTPRNGNIKITLTQTDNKAIISFKDSGIGIPESFQSCLFEKTIQTQRLGTENEPSSGLGLFIIKKLIKELNGAIWYESHENEGTTFHISLDKINFNQQLVS